MRRKDSYTPEEWRKILDRDNERRRRPEEAAKRREYQRVYQKSPKGRAKDKARYNERRKNSITDSARRRKYGITPEEFALLLITQDGRCAVCRTPFVMEGKARRFIHVDHCHDTRRVRGLLCGHCNVAEGYIHKLGLTPEEFAQRMREYLDNPPAQQEVLW